MPLCGYITMAMKINSSIVETLTNIQSLPSRLKMNKWHTLKKKPKTQDNQEMETYSQDVT